jgi:hypothetical protein
MLKKILISIVCCSFFIFTPVVFASGGMSDSSEETKVQVFEIDRDFFCPIDKIYEDKKLFTSEPNKASFRSWVQDMLYEELVEKSREKVFLQNEDIQYAIKHGIDNLGINYDKLILNENIYFKNNKQNKTTVLKVPIHAKFRISKSDVNVDLGSSIDDNISSGSVDDNMSSGSSIDERNVHYDVELEYCKWDIFSFPGVKFDSEGNRIEERQE